MPPVVWRVLDLLLTSTRPRPLAEVVAEIGSPVAVADALDTLRAAGLAGRMGALVFVTGAPRHELVYRPPCSNSRTSPQSWHGARDDSYR